MVPNQKTEMEHRESDRHAMITTIQKEVRCAECRETIKAKAPVWQEIRYSTGGPYLYHAHPECRQPETTADAHKEE